MESTKNKEFSANTTEKCILCGKETEYINNTPIEDRQFYIEGAGQLCQNCYYDLYIKQNDSEIIKVKEIQPYQLKTTQKIYSFFKSLIDFSIALISLILLLPLFLVVAIAIKCDSNGPVFFVQKRIGKNGKLFNCLKFRSMSVQAKPNVAGYEYENVKSYITKTGAFIRKYSIDELPQLLNILTFKMSLIGYRPSQPCEETLNTARENYDLYQIRPGISGWAQVNGRDYLAAKPNIKAEFDAYYLRHFSLWIDIKIFFMTMANVFKHSDIIEGVVQNAEQAIQDNHNLKNNN